MTSLKPTTRLQCIPKLDIQLKANDVVRLKWGRKHLNSGIYTLAILNAFRQPKSFEAGQQQVVEAEQGDESVISNTIEKLFHVGVLRGAQGTHKTKTSTTFAFNNPSIHIEMLNDRARTEHYLKAIREVVRPGDIVVDLGTGTGVLALAAAKAGAGHVYAIEINKGIAEVAQANFERNGFSDRITLCSGRSTDISLPERADVLVSEIIGDDPFNEQIIEMTSDARLRFLKPNARMVPDSIEVFGLPLTIPAAKYAKHKFSNQSVNDWSGWYDIDFSALTGMQHDENEPLFDIPPQKAKGWNRTHAPLCLASVDLHQDQGQRLDWSESIRAQTSGLLNGLLIYFEVQLSPQTRLSTHPDNASSENHWCSPVWGVIPTIDVEVGDEVTVKYEADSRSNWTYAHVFKAKS